MFAHRSRAGIAAAGAALICLSLLLSVGPVLGAANNGNNGNGRNGGGNATSGTVKVHDADTGLEASETGNEPQVCDFFLGFTSDPPFEAGTWVVLSWPPTGDGSTVVSGSYDTGGDGTDYSSVISLPAGHYRVEWTANGANAAKNKTLWVDAGCSEDPAPPADESPVEDPAPPADESPAEDPAPSADESPAEDPAPPADESPVEDPAPPADESPVEQAVEPSDESPVEDPAPPSDNQPAESSAESPAEQPAAGDDAGAGDPGSSPEQNQLDHTAGADGATMPDTALPAVPAGGGALATIGVLLLIAAPAAGRRERRPERA